MTTTIQSYLYPGYTLQAFAVARSRLYTLHQPFTENNPLLGRVIKLSCHYAALASSYIEIPLRLVENVALLAINVAATAVDRSYAPNVICCIASIASDTPKLALIALAAYSQLVRRILVVYSVAVNPITTRVGKGSMEIEMSQYYRVAAIRKHGWKAIFTFELDIGMPPYSREPAKSLHNYKILAATEDLNPYLEQAVEYAQLRKKHLLTSARQTPLPVILLQTEENDTDFSSNTSSHEGIVRKILFYTKGNTAFYTKRLRKIRLCKIIGIPSNKPDSELKAAAQNFYLKIHPDKNPAPQAKDAFLAFRNLHNQVLKDCGIT